MADRRKEPRIEVLGLYSPIANRAAYERCVAAYVADCDPSNLSESMRAFFVSKGRRGEPLTPEEREDAAGYIERSLSEAVYVEALVTNADERFDAGDFQQPDPSLPPGQTQVAWNEIYLSKDGEAVLSGRCPPQFPSDEQFRVVFVIHRWKPHLPLESSYGELACPDVQPLPDRLWRLAPYEMVD